MAQINVRNLTYCYEGSYDDIFENVSFSIDTNWKIGFIGRNGKGKTTFLKLLLGKYEYSGTIATSTVFDYFPYPITEQEAAMCASDFLLNIKPGCEEWKVICELGKLDISAEVLYRPFDSLSHGERTKVLLAVLFSGDNDFLLIDEPTNHLDQKSADRSNRWAQKSENSKIGFDTIKEHDRSISTRAYIGTKTKKMQSRVKQYERRIEQEIRKKEDLLQDIENTVSLKLFPLTYHKQRLIRCRNATIGYESGRRDVLNHFSFELMQGERVFLHGENGCGKSTFIKAVLGCAGMGQQVNISEGELEVGAGIKISYINQDTSFLKGDMQIFCKQRDLDESLFFALLRQLDMERVQFTKHMEELSEGQKKKVLIASSLMTPAHVYIWDEPLNYIDVFSRMQIEELLLKFEPTMILVDHDLRFQEKIATRVIELGRTKDHIYMEDSL